MSVLMNNSLDNYIITHSGVVVKVKDEEKKEKAFTKWTEKKKQNTKIARKLLKLSQLCEDMAETAQEEQRDKDALILRANAEIYKKRSYRMKECARFVTFNICPECNRSIGSSATLCRDRVCPTCAWRLSAQQSAEMLQTLAYITDIDEYTAVFLTLTVQNCDVNQLAPTLEMMSSAWHRMLARKKNKEIIAGSARSVEITYNHKANTFHPHFHAILLLENCSMTMGELNLYFNKQWQSAARLIYQPITDLRAIENKKLLENNTSDAEKYKNAILETFKYTIKDDTLAEMPLSTFRYYIDGIQNKRLVSYTGIIKEARTKLEFSEELQDEQEIKKCDECSTEMISAVYRWSFRHNTYKRFLEYL